MNDSDINYNSSDYEVIYQAETLRCSRCKNNINKDWKFCNKCGNNLTLSKPSKALDFIEKINHDNFLNKSTYSSIVINNNSNNIINQYVDNYDDDDNYEVDFTKLNIDEKVLNAINDRINSFNSETYKKYKKKMILAEMLADELEQQNADFVENSYIGMVNDYKKNDDREMLTDFIV